MQPLQSKERALLAARTADDKKAEDIVVFHMEGLTIVADYYVLCTGQNRIQVQAIADAVREKMEEAGEPARHVEGYDRGRWILLDFNDVIVHVFDRESREFYDLDRLWADAPRLEPSLSRA